MPFGAGSKHMGNTASVNPPPGDMTLESPPQAGKRWLTLSHPLILGAVLYLMLAKRHTGPRSPDAVRYLGQANGDLRAYLVYALVSDAVI